MNKFLAGCLVVLVAAIAVQFASSATSSSSASIPARVKALEKKVKVLTASVKTLRAKTNCLGAQGVTQYGNPAAGQGYVYTEDGGVTLVLTTGFDGPIAGQAPSFYAATVDSSCVSTPGAAYKLGHSVPAHRSVRVPK